MIYANFKEMDQSLEDRKELFYYSKSPNGFLLLAGSNGSGKSYAAEAIYNMNTTFKLPAYDHDQAIFVNQIDLNNEWMANLTSANVILDKYKKTKIMVLDDVGTRTPSEGFMDFLYGIVDYRWRFKHMLGTILTTNLNATFMREKFGDAFVSRVASGIVKRWDHPDRRFKNF